MNKPKFGTTAARKRLETALATLLDYEGEVKAALAREAFKTAILHSSAGDPNNIYKALRTLIAYRRQTPTRAPLSGTGNDKGSRRGE